MAFLSSPGSTIEVDTANIQVSTVSTPVSSVNLEQIQEDDLEEMDLKWLLALLSMRARRPRNKDSSRKTMNMEDTSSKLMVEIDGAGFDWSYMADDDVRTNMALMAFSDSKKEKESNQIKIDNFENASKSLDKLIGSQISDNSRTGVGFASYNVVTPPPTGLFAPLTIDLSNSGLEEFQYPKFEGYGPKETSPISQIIKNMMEDLLLLHAVLKELPDESQVLLKVPRKNNMYSFDLKNIVPSNGKFYGKADEGFLVGYSINNKAFRVYNSKNRKVEENLHVNFLENKPNVAGSNPKWLFDIDSLTNSMNYQPVSAENRTNSNAGSKINSNAGQAGKEKVPDQEYILLPLLNTPESSPKDVAGKKSTAEQTFIEGSKIDDLGSLDQQMKSTNDLENTNSINTASPTVNVASNKDGTFQRTNDEWNFSTPITVNAARSFFSHPAALDDFSKMTNLKDTSIFDVAYDDRDEGVETDYNNLETIISVSPISSTRIYKDHPKEQIIKEVHFAVQTRKMAKQNEAGIEAIKFFLAYASFMDFTVYQMEVKSAFLYGTIEEEVYVSQPPAFVDLEFSDKVYKVEKALYGLHQAPRAWYETLSTYLLENGFRRGTIDKTLFIKNIKNDILLVQVYVDDIIFGSTKSHRSACLSWGIWGEVVGVVGCGGEAAGKGGSGVAVKRIFRYLKGQPTLGLWYPKESPLELIAYSDSDYAGASLDRNQQHETKIYVDNESAICVVKNPVYHSKTKRIEIRHHFIRDSYEKRLIEMVKIHTDYNVADLLTKAFDVT
nr:putative ribonuclease H-like domain-containing protein [Tanacetum cinerariifolium]